jgi:hypothetical protein
VFVIITAAHACADCGFIPIQTFVSHVFTTVVQDDELPTGSVQGNDGVVSEDLMVVDKIRHDETLPSETAKSETVRNETVISETATGVTESIETAMNIKENIEIYLNICIHLIRLQAFNVQNCSCYIASLERFVLFVATRSDTSNLQHFTRVASIHTHYTLSFLHTRHSSLG